MTANEFHLNALTYEHAIRYTAEVYRELIITAGRAIDFELSIDETATPTTPAAHRYVAEELQLRGIGITSLAPRFCGEFQKGIDYIGDRFQFETELAVHAALADYYGYKLSIHSGSDKFSIFDLIGKYTGLRVHVKTAGTNWLEALRVIAATDPALYRELHAFAGEHLDKARAWYHVACDPGRIEPAALRADRDLPRYLDEDDARQMLHITYGLILTAQHADGSPLYRTRIYDHLARHEGAYVSSLRAHIGRHLDTLGYPPAEQ
jgi:hypothetical protein